VLNVSSPLPCLPPLPAVPGKFLAKTSDHEDHSFNGIMFNVSLKPNQTLPIEYIELQSVWVRGGTSYSFKASYTSSLL
jgi:hypothetical protein